MSQEKIPVKQPYKQFFHSLYKFTKNMLHDSLEEPTCLIAFYERNRKIKAGEKEQKRGAMREH